jgi:lipoprotein-anchoring transpeptidase ErfK/SrfK
MLRRWVLPSMLVMCFSRASFALNIQEIREEIVDFRQRLEELNVGEVFTEGYGDNVEPRHYDNYINHVKRRTYRNNLAHEISDMALQWGKDLRERYQHELKGKPIVGRIVIDIGANLAYWFHDNEVIDSVLIAVGDETARKGTKIGTYRVGQKVKYPVSHWTNITMPYGHPYNSFGSRKLMLYQNNIYTYYAAHGTNAESSVGKHISMGCIRFYNSDALILYELVTTRTTVEIIRGKPRVVQIARRVRPRRRIEPERRVEPKPVVTIKPETKTYNPSVSIESVQSDNLSEVYKAWIEETINYSRSARCAVLIVYKLEHEMDLYDNGELIKTYNVELGHNSIDDKLRRGDGCTPEGMYYVSRKLDIGQSSYHRAFLINYPDDYDRGRFYQAKRTGEIPLQSSIGGDIEIHGRGGKGMDWTHGCVALKNWEIDELFPLIDAGYEWGSGTPVTIVKYNPIAR